MTTQSADLDNLWGAAIEDVSTEAPEAAEAVETSEPTTEAPDAVEGTTEAPETTEAPAETTPPKVSTEEAKLIQENTELKETARQQKRQAEQQAENADLMQRAANWAQGRMTELTNQGHDPEVAKQIAVLEAKNEIAAQQAVTANNRAARIETAQEFGVPLSELENIHDEAEMRRHAAQYSSTTGPSAKRISTLEAQVASMQKEQKKAGVPAQEFATPGSSTGRGGAEAINKAYANGEINWGPRVAAARKELGFD